MSAEISPLLVRTPAAARPLWLRLRRSSPFTLTVLMCCLALLWVSPFIWMLATSFSATTFGDDMATSSEAAAQRIYIWNDRRG